MRSEGWGAFDQSDPRCLARERAILQAFQAKDGARSDLRSEHLEMKQQYCTYDFRSDFSSCFTSQKGTLALQCEIRGKPQSRERKTHSRDDAPSLDVTAVI